MRNMRMKYQKAVAPALLAAVIGALSAGAAPTLQIIYPRPSADVEGVVNLRVFAYEGAVLTQTAQVDTVKFFRKADSANKILLTRIASSGEWSGVWNASALPNGADTLVFRGINSGATTKTDSVFVVTLANNGVVTAPTVEITSPTPGSSLAGTQSIAFTATAGAGTLSTREVSVDGAAYSATSAAAAHSLNTVNLTDGAHTVRIKVTNSNGAATESRLVTYHVANAPGIAWTSPAGGSAAGGLLILNYDATPRGSATISSDSLFIDGAAFASLNVPDGLDTVDLSGLADGTHLFHIKATDNAGKTGLSGTVALPVRNSPTALIDSALADSIVSGRLVVRFRMAAVAPATLAQRQIAFDGGSWWAAAGDSTDTVDTRGMGEGAHSAQVRAVDNQGRTGLSRLVQFSVHNAPQVSILSPAVDAFAKGTITIRFRAEAVAPDTIARTEISLGGGAWTATTTDSNHSLDSRAFKDGDLRFQIRAVDGNGKSAITLAREVVVDNSPPKVSYPSVGYPSGSPTARLGTHILVTAQGLDLGSGMHPDSAMAFSSDSLSVASARMRDDGQQGDKVAGDNVFTLDLAIASTATGSLPFRIRARDALGNDSTVTGALALDNLPPVLTLRVSPAPGASADALSGDVNVDRVAIAGTFSDSGGSGLAGVILSVRNPDSGHVNSSPEAIPLLDGAFKRLVELVPGRNRITLMGTDRAGNSDTLEADLNYVVPKASKIVPASGGEVQAADRSGVSIPTGAMDAAHEITILPADARLEPKPIDAGVRLVGVPHEFGPDGMVYAKPVKLTLGYTAADLDRDQDGKPDFSEDRLTIVFWNGRTWLKAGDAAIDKINRTVSVAVNHFTLFDIAEVTTAAPAAVVGYWDRNPVPGQAEFIYQVPKPGTVSLTLLDMAGDVAKQLIAPGTRVASSGSVRWDGSNTVGRFSGAGLYIYVFRYKSDDGTSEKLIRKPVGLIGK